MASATALSIYRFTLQRHIQDESWVSFCFFKKLFFFLFFLRGGHFYDSYITSGMSFKLSSFTLIVRYLLLIKLQKAALSGTKHLLSYSLSLKKTLILNTVIEEDMIFFLFYLQVEQNEIHGQCLINSIKQYWAHVTLLYSPEVCHLMYCKESTVTARWQTSFN